MNFLKSKILNKQYDVFLSPSTQSIELRSKEQPVLVIKINEILNLNYFKPKQFGGNERYWLNLKTKKNGTLFFSTQFSDESFIKNFIELVPLDQLEKIEKCNLMRLTYYYILPFIIFGIYFIKFEEKGFNGLLVLGFFFFIFNSIAIYNEHEKFKKYKKMKNI